MSDDEMREAISTILTAINPGTLTVGDYANAILAKLRALGAWLPGSEVSDEMTDTAVVAYERCLKTHNLSGPEAEWSSMRAAITAALNATPRSGT